MPFQLRLVRKNAVQAAIRSRVVDLAFFYLQQIVQRRRRIPALLDGKFAAREPLRRCVILQLDAASGDFLILNQFSMRKGGLLLVFLVS
jgi:hypothetical protein